MPETSETEQRYADATTRCPHCNHHYPEPAGPHLFFWDLAALFECGVCGEHVVSLILFDVQPLRFQIVSYKAHAERALLLCHKSEAGQGLTLADFYEAIDE